MNLRQTADEFVRRMEAALDEMHEAILNADVDAQVISFGALTGLVGMMKSAIIHGTDDNGG